MDFDKRLEKAIDRGRQTRAAQGQKQASDAMSIEDLKNLHSKCRLDLSEHIETCLRQLSDHFPGFQFQSVVSEEGWGAKISRDDFVGGRGDVKSLYSRTEMLIRPFSSTHIIELAAKATVRNKEIFNRSHFQFLNQVDVDSFRELIDLWALEYAEQFAARM
ncbi:MAG: hypothetical protein HON53_01815 [Planctomycetaceae bacterium]|jgi:hypothetical protein|nr:hypothetical protein [Planctomycetaceae bacterium]MBT6157052.1 hypothetical protein [Planctomycetaceae bacterium]MBT6484382.1 hypothetical protein [Planctomycetaceae bacterium]MBT6498017.1 hypothetical protein [Planctomycetaceae bacterium]